MIESHHIYYKDGYKYQLSRPARFSVEIIGLTVSTQYISLDADGWLDIDAGYAWDGPSGPTFDTKSSLRGSLVHDALYQLMRLGLISQVWRQAADKELKKRCEDDGMWSLRAEMWYEAVQLMAADAASPRSRKKELTAP